MTRTQDNVANDITASVSATGSGDAVYGDKVMGNKYITIIQSDVSLEPVKPVLLDIVQKLGEGKKGQAEDMLRALGMLGNLNSTARIAIACLKSVSYIELSDDEKQIIKTAYSESSSQDKDFQDFLNAAAINLLREQKSEQELKDFYCDLPANPCTDIAYYKTLTKISSSDDISRELSSFSLPVLHLLLEKALASGKHDICQQIFDELKKKDLFSDFSGQAIILECISINKFQINDYLLLSTEQKEYLDNVIEKLTNFTSNLQSIDKQYLGLACQLLLYTQFTNSKLHNFVKDHRSLLNQIDFRGKDVVISFLDHDNAVQLPSPLKSEHEIALEIIEDVKKEKFSTRKILVLCEKKNPESVEFTLNELMKLDKTTTSLACYCALAAKAADFLDKSQFPLLKIEKILSDDFKGETIESNFLLSTANFLSIAGYKGLSLLALGLLFKDKSPWISDAYSQYLSLLYENEQYNSLNTHLSTMSDQEQSHPDIVNLKSCIASHADKFPEAVKLIEEQLKSYHGRPLSESEKKYCIYLWLSLLINLNRSISTSNLAEYVKKIPISIFSDPDNELAWDLLTFFGERYIEVEDTVLTWFFTDPNKYANQLFKVVMNRPPNITQVGYNSGIFKAGYLYTENKQPKYRMVVDDQRLTTENPQYLIHPSTSLAQRLQSKEKKPYFIHNTKHCLIQEILPPTIAAHRIAVNILDNDENQTFSSISFPENATGEEIMEVLTNFLDSNHCYSPTVKNYLRGNFPCIFKYQLINANNSYGKALTAILSKNVYMELFSDNDAPFEESNSEDFILDEVGFAFLVVSGLFTQIEARMHITSDTAKQIKEWCYTYGDQGIVFDPEKDNFIALGNEENLDQNLNLRNITEKLLKKCNIHNERDYDVPLKLTILADQLLSPSTKSSLGLAHTKGFSYFTVDSQLRAFFSKPEFSSVNIAPISVKDFMLGNSNVDEIGRLLALHQHNFNLFLPWAVFNELCFNGSEESLHNLTLFIDDINNFEKEVVEKNIEIVVKTIFIKRLNDLNSHGLNYLLESLFTKLFESIHTPKEVALVFINTPSPSIFQPFEKELLKTLTLHFIGNAMIMATSSVVAAYSNALKKSIHNSSKVAKEIEGLC
ncbi:hypothetical protein V6255_06155 [Psychromonas arctica]|uniref:Uncharacterized protein n=1 Tax=Psychromonas arctica TaxID=168275 RepID=A0ABU9HA24_9GAMM